jgi:hypothetical protein
MKVSSGRPIVIGVAWGFDVNVDILQVTESHIIEPWPALMTALSTMAVARGSGWNPWA